jgi:hypothetical protein
MVTCHMLHVVQCLGQSRPANGPWMYTVYVLLWCIVTDIMTHETLTRRPRRLGSFTIFLLRERASTTIIHVLLGSRVVLNTVPV